MSDVTAFGSLLMGFLVQQVIEIDGSSGPVGSYKKAIFGLQIVSALILSKLAPSVFSPPVMFQASLCPHPPPPPPRPPCETLASTGEHTPQIANPIKVHAIRFVMLHDWC